MRSGKGKQRETGVKGFTCCHKAVLGTAKHGIQGFLALAGCPCPVQWAIPALPHCPVIKTLL